MTDTDTDRRALPVPLAASASRPSLARSAPTAAFVSQLLAAHDRLPPQRSRRTGTVETAVGAYGSGARIAMRRMPQGYRTTVIA